ncbi:hypothetical protein TKK_0014640 [Trichogramma kaykai]
MSSDEYEQAEINFFLLLTLFTAADDSPLLYASVKFIHNKFKTIIPIKDIEGFNELTWPEHEKDFEIGKIYTCRYSDAKNPNKDKFGIQIGFFTSNPKDSSRGTFKSLDLSVIERYKNEVEGSSKNESKKRADAKMTKGSKKAKKKATVKNKNGTQVKNKQQCKSDQLDLIDRSRLLMQTNNLKFGCEDSTKQISPSVDGVTNSSENKQSSTLEMSSSETSSNSIKNERRKKSIVSVSSKYNEATRPPEKVQPKKFKNSPKKTSSNSIMHNSRDVTKSGKADTEKQSDGPVPVTTMKMTSDTTFDFHEEDNSSHHSSISSTPTKLPSSTLEDKQIPHSVHSSKLKTLLETIRRLENQNQELQRDNDNLMKAVKEGKELYEKAQEKLSSYATFNKCLKNFVKKMGNDNNCKMGGTDIDDDYCEENDEKPIMNASKSRKRAADVDSGCSLRSSSSGLQDDSKKPKKSMNDKIAYEIDDIKTPFREKFVDPSTGKKMIYLRHGYTLELDTWKNICNKKTESLFCKRLLHEFYDYNELRRMCVKQQQKHILTTPNGVNPKIEIPLKFVDMTKKCLEYYILSRLPEGTKVSTDSMLKDINRATHYFSEELNVLKRKKTE